MTRDASYSYDRAASCGRVRAVLVPGDAYELVSGRRVVS